MRKIISIVLCFLLTTSLCLFMTGCDEDSSVSKTVLYELCKEEYAGRLPGTQGNEKAAEYISSFFSKNDFTPFDEKGYFISYSQDTVDPNEQETTIEITYQDGTTKTLQYGVDFVTSANPKDLAIDLPLAFNIDDVKPETIPCLFEDKNFTDEKRGDLGNQNHPAWILSSDNWLYTTIRPESARLFINIPPSIYNELKKDGAVSAKIKSKCVIKKSTLNNVVAMIKGKSDNKKAVVLTAHFDHVGKQGDYLYAGALDNASGVATMLSTALKLKQLTKDNPLDFDIIIGATNSEEISYEFYGSNKLSSMVAEKYDTAYNINIDCVGNNKAGDLSMCELSPQSAMLNDGFKDTLDKAKIKYCDSKALGDHSAFTKYYPAIALQQDTKTLFDFIHTPDDTPDKIDVDVMEKLADIVANFVFSQSEALLHESEHSHNEDTDDWQAIEQAFKEAVGNKELKVDEQYYFEFNNKIYAKKGNPYLYSSADVKNYYPKVSFPEKIQDYQFLRFTNYGIGGSGVTPLGNNEQLNTIYQFDYTAFGLNDVHLIYEGKDDILAIAIFTKNSAIYKTLKAEAMDSPYENYSVSVNPDNTISSIHFSDEKYQFVISSRSKTTYEGYKYDYEYNYLSETQAKQLLDKFDFVKLFKDISL